MRREVARDCILGRGALSRKRESAVGPLPRLLESNVHISQSPMSDPVDRPMSPASGERDASETAGGAAQAESERFAAEVDAPRQKRPVSIGMLIGVVALAIAAAVAVWLDGRRAQNALRVEAAQRLSAIESSTQASGKAQTQLAAELREAQAKVTLLEARLAESQAQQAALEALYRDLAPSRDEIAISEIEQVLLVASQQLLLAGNVSSALTALQLADTKLQRLDRPQFVPLRRALARDMDRLKAVPYVDIVGMSLKLDQAISAVDTLP